MPTPTPPGQDPPNRFPQIFGFMGSFLTLATIALTLRIVSRLKFSYIGYDDIAISIAYVLFVGLIIATVFATKYGLGIHIWDVDYPKVGVSMQKVCCNVLSVPLLRHRCKDKLLMLDCSLASAARSSTPLHKASSSSPSSSSFLV